MVNDIEHGSFIWNKEKEKSNKKIHRLSFEEASEAFLDPHRIIAIDGAHSQKEPRYFCIGKIKERVATVRFTYRKNKIRIIGAGFWRKGRKFYEKKNKKYH